MTSNSYKTFGLSCPNGGDFHICENTKREFIGCCTMDPCADGSGLCDEMHLRAASFSESSYLDIPPQSCETSDGADQFYTCKANDPPFLGCCTINPCVNMTCPSANLRAAILSSDHDDRASFLAPSSSSNSGKDTAVAKSSSTGLSSGAIAGLVVTIIVLVMLIAGAWFWRRVNWNPFNSTKPGNQDDLLSKSAKDSLMESPRSPESGYTNSSSSSLRSQSTDPRTMLYSPASGSPLPPYQRLQLGHQHSPNGQWHAAQTTQPPAPTFQYPRDGSGTWPFQSTMYQAHPSPPPKLPRQHAWPSRQSVHELLAEVQRSKLELPVQERVPELRSSCVVQPLRPPPPLKAIVSDAAPDSPTLGPPFSTKQGNPIIRAVAQGRPTNSTPTGCQNWREGFI